MNYELYNDNGKCGEMTEAERKALLKKASLTWGVWARGVGVVKLLLLVLSFFLFFSFSFQLFQEPTFTKYIQIAALFVSQIVAVCYVMSSLNKEIEAEYLHLVRIEKGLPDDGELIVAKNGYAPR